MVARGQSLTELAGIGPYLNKQIIDWLSIRQSLWKQFPRSDRTS